MYLTKLEVLTGKTLYFLTLVLAFMLPFTVLRPIVFLLTFNFNNVEVILVLTCIVGLLHLITLFLSDRLSIIGTLIQTNLITIFSAFAFLLSALLSALIAPTHSIEALTFTLRIVTGIYIFLLVLYVANSRGRIIRLAQFLVFGAGLSAMIGLGEIAHLPALDEALLLFKEAPSQVGGAIRLSATFQYTTIASMYYEMAVLLALTLAVVSHRKYVQVIYLAIVLICTIAVFLTLTRSGMATLFIAGMIYVGLGVWRYRQLLFPSSLLMITILSVLSVMVLNPAGVFITRLTTEDDSSWYDAEYQVPAMLEIKSGTNIRIPVEITNTGRVTWQTSGENPYQLGLYWSSQIDNKPLDQPHQAVDLPNNVAPGESIKFDVEMEVQLPAGDYSLHFGMLQSDILWFRHRGTPEVTTMVQIQPAISTETVQPAIGTAETPPGGEIGDGLSATVSRLDLWRVAIMMFQERPLFGVGPDNFRLLYGRYLGYKNWYLGNHSNNLYLELLATTGLLGFIAFMSFTLTLLYSLWKQMRSFPSSIDLLSSGLGGVLLVFFMHGMFDYFLPFLPVLGFFWMTAGLITALNVHKASAMTASHVGENSGLAQSDKHVD